MNAANLLAYGRWHARDALVRALAPVGFFALIATLNVWGLVDRHGIDGVRAAGRVRDGVQALYDQLMPLTMTLGALTVGSGFVALDRQRGHVRFLFATPVVAWQYYLARYLVGLALYVGAFLLVPVGFGTLVFAVPVLPVLVSTACYGLLFGTLALLAGALTERDGAVLLVGALVSFTLQSIVRTAQGAAPRWMEALAAALPPFETLDRLRTAWLQGAPVDTGDVTLVLGYAVAMLVTALVTIARAPLVR